MAARNLAVHALPVQARLLRRRAADVVRAASSAPARDRSQRMHDGRPARALPRVGGGPEVALATATPDGRPIGSHGAAEERGRTGIHVLQQLRVAQGPRARGEPAGRAAVPPARDPGAGGRAGRARPPQESDAYWETRPAASRRSAAASRQSEPIASREALEAAVAEQPPEPPRPASWGGYRLIPDAYEFWRHRDDRLHERHSFRRRGGEWEVLLLQP